MSKHHLPYAVRTAPTRVQHFMTIHEALDYAAPYTARVTHTATGTPITAADIAREERDYRAFVLAMTAE